MTDLAPMPALGGTTPGQVTHGALSLCENPDLALVSLALRRGALPPPGLPGPGRYASGAFWTGPGQWMSEQPVEAPGCSVTDQSDGWFCCEIASAAGGAPIVALVEKLVNIDAAGFAPGAASRCAMEHMSVVLIRRAEDRLAVLGMRSAAGSIWHALVTAAERLALS